jgi:hypothetical protein
MTPRSTAQGRLHSMLLASHVKCHPYLKIQDLTTRRQEKGVVGNKIDFQSASVLHRKESIANGNSLSIALIL